VLERKPGALAGSTPLDQWRRAGKWPASYDRLWEALMERQGKQAGTKAMAIGQPIAIGIAERFELGA
jgi:hypothetical protein